MATGILGTADLAAAANATVYTVPADTFSVVTVNITNRNSASVILDLLCLLQAHQLTLNI